jgi:hypothetical protein
LGYPIEPCIKIWQLFFEFEFLKYFWRYFSPKIIEFETQNVQVFSSSSHQQKKKLQTKKAALDNHCAAFFFYAKFYTIMIFFLNCHKFNEFF